MKPKTRFPRAGKPALPAFAACSLFALSRPAAAQFPANFGFEAPSLGSGSSSYQYNPSGASWTFSAQSGSSGSGISGNGSGFTSGDPNAPQGSQVAFLQSTGNFYQAISGFQAGVTYSYVFYGTQRSNSQSSFQTFSVALDGTTLDKFRPSTNTYVTFSTGTFTTTAGTHTLTFTGLNPNGGDNTVFLDAVVPNTALAVTDAGFESPSEGSGFAYNPSGAGWTFTAQSGNSGSGISGNGSGFTSSNTTAPEGSQVAFLQGSSSMSQTISGFQANQHYTISFLASQRLYSTKNQNFEVLLDSTVLGTFDPASLSNGGYVNLSTSAFQTTTGSHVLEFLGLDTASPSGDNTIFLDDIHVSSYAPSPVALPLFAGGMSAGLIALRRRARHLRRRISDPTAHEQASSEKQ